MFISKGELMAIHWTLQDDNNLATAHKDGLTFREISEDIDCLSIPRTEKACRTRYDKLMRQQGRYMPEKMNKKYAA